MPKLAWKSAEESASESAGPKWSAEEGAEKAQINSVQTRCIVKARLSRIHFSGNFLGVFDFLRIACSLGIPQENL